MIVQLEVPWSVGISCRGALQSGLKAVFLTGAIALLIALLIIITIPEVSIEEDVGG